jgi:hypothetical protein
LKLVAWRKKIPGFASQAACQANYCRSIYSDHSCSKRTNGFERILAHRIDCQRAKPPCPAERHTHNSKSISGDPSIVNQIPARFPQTYKLPALLGIAASEVYHFGVVRCALGSFGWQKN